MSTLENMIVQTLTALPNTSVERGIQPHSLNNAMKQYVGLCLKKKGPIHAIFFLKELLQGVAQEEISEKQNNGWPKHLLDAYVKVYEELKYFIQTTQEITVDEKVRQYKLALEKMYFTPEQIEESALGYRKSLTQ